MDFDDIVVTERTVDIIHPATKEPTGLKVTLMSPSDDRLAKLRDKIAQEQLSLQTKGKVEKVENLKENRKKILFTATTGWEWTGDACYKGEKPALTYKNFSEICDAKNWLLQQIDDAFGETESFFIMREEKSLNQ